MSMALPVLCIQQTSAEDKGTMRDMTTAEIVKDMGIGINLGNTMEACVDWTLETNMYAIINIHWDGGWVNNFPENKDESMKRFQVMWEQISDNFKDYGDHLMFESQNEELGWEKLWNPWGGTEGKAESYALVNEINRKFVNVIRSSGGNNPERHLLISGYNTGIDRVCDPLFKMPDDPAVRMAACCFSNIE